MPVRKLARGIISVIKSAVSSKLPVSLGLIEGVHHEATKTRANALSCSILFQSAADLVPKTKQQEERLAGLMASPPSLRRKLRRIVGGWKRRLGAKTPRVRDKSTPATVEGKVNSAAGGRSKVMNEGSGRFLDVHIVMGEEITVARYVGEQEVSRDELPISTATIEVEDEGYGLAKRQCLSASCDPVCEFKEPLGFRRSLQGLGVQDSLFDRLVLCGSPSKGDDENDIDVVTSELSMLKLTD